VTSRRVAILGEPTGWHAARLADTLTARGHAVAIMPWHQLSAGVADAGGAGETIGPAPLAEADLVVVRGMPGGSQPERWLQEVIFRMNLLGRLSARGGRVINSPRSLEVAIDKHLTLCHVAAAGLAVPATCVVQDPAAAVAAWDHLGGDCLLKPLFGSRGRGIVRLRSAADVEAATQSPAVATSCGGVFYIQQFIPHPGWDVRILLVGDRSFAMRRHAGPGEWRTNLTCGGHAEPFMPPSVWLDQARQAAEAVGTEIAGVDLLPTADGGVVVLEVNGVPGWRGLEAATGADITGTVAEFVERAADHAFSRGVARAVEPALADERRQDAESESGIE
jgi:RimK family alpha-L-glutamate ligase